MMLLSSVQFKQICYNSEEDTMRNDVPQYSKVTDENKTSMHSNACLLLDTNQYGKP